MTSPTFTRREAKPDSRQIRVFVSSTFRDMQAERDELVRHVFPRLRKLCEQRGVVWGEVDLRWGVTDEKKAEGQVLPLCLAEIRRCRPYFIGLLGERYGWVPDALPAELLVQEPWLAGQGDRSVTELEIRHGVLNDPAQAGKAYFYFRDPAYLASLPPEERARCLEEPAPEEISAFGPGEARLRAASRRDRLEALKRRIRESGYPLAEGYADPQALGALVLRDLTAIIDRDYPADRIPDALEREALAHEAFAESRAQVYVGRRRLFDALDAHARGDQEPLVVQGESGMGKSALLANWVRHHRESPPAETVIQHYLSASSAATDWTALVRRLMGEFNRRFDLGVEIPDKPDALRLAFADSLHRVAARGRVVIVIDGLNQLEDREGALDLAWLPPVIPPNIRLLLSTLPGRPQDEARRRGWPVLDVMPLDEAERREVIRAYLAQYAKELGAAHVAHIAGAPPCTSPLYLRTLLEELRLHGDHFTLAAHIAHYLEAPDIAGLYQRVLERYEADYERDRPGLVRDALTLVWAARRGLAEVELLELLGDGGTALPHAVWSPLHLAAESVLVNRSGLLGFAHDHFRRAVEAKYLPDAGACDAAHLRLAEYFGGDHLFEGNRLAARAVDELPWQLAEAGSWSVLTRLLRELAFFEEVWAKAPYDTRAWWAKIERHSSIKLVEAYEEVLAAPEAAGEAAGAIAILLFEAGYWAEAGNLWASLSRNAEITGRLEELSGYLGNQAVVLRDRGDLDGAMALIKEVERLCRELDSKDDLQACLGNQAAILYIRGDLDCAMALLREQERLCRELGSKDGLSKTLGSQAVILHDRRDLEGATAMLKEEESICRELGNKDGLRANLNSQAVILNDRGDLDGALALHKDAERICRELGSKDGLSTTLGNQALILADLGDLDSAMALHKEEESICRELGNKDGLASSLNNQALILKARGDLDGAMALHKEQEFLCREIDSQGHLQVCLSNQAGILYDRGDQDGALAVFKEEERLCRELGNKDALRICLGNQIVILRERGDRFGVIALLKEQKSLRRKLGSKDSRRAALRDQALRLHEQGDLAGALALYREEEHLWRQLGSRENLQVCLGNQAVILNALGDLSGAIVLHQEEERLCREIGNKDGLSACLGNQALIRCAEGDLDGAMALHKEEERLCREIGSKDGLSFCLGNQALLLRDRGDFDGAMALLDEVERLCRELGNQTGLDWCESAKAAVLETREMRSNPMPNDAGN